MKLTPEQKAKIAAGHFIALTGKGVCPAAKGDVLQVKPRLELRVLAVERGSDIREWRLRYEVRDSRDQVRLLRRTPPMVPPSGEDRPNEDEIQRAARESSYTPTAHNALVDAGEAVDEATQRRFVKEAETGLKAQLERERRERRARALDERLRNVQSVAERKGIDLSRKLRRVEAAVEAAEREVGRDAA